MLMWIDVLKIQRRQKVKNQPSTTEGTGYQTFLILVFRRAQLPDHRPLPDQKILSVEFPGPRKPGAIHEVSECTRNIDDQQDDCQLPKTWNEDFHMLPERVIGALSV